MRLPRGLGLLLAWSLLGCGDPKEPCIEAQTHIDECSGVVQCASCDEEWVTTLVCEGVTLCAAHCIHDEAGEGCAVLKDAYGGMPTTVSKAYFDCLAECPMP
jgi:hypothetical protein